jgi:hypothetical protein
MLWLWHRAVLPEDTTFRKNVLPPSSGSAFKMETACTSEELSFLMLQDIKGKR